MILYWLVVLCIVPALDDTVLVSCGIVPALDDTVLVSCVVYSPSTR